MKNLISIFICILTLCIAFVACEKLTSVSKDYISSSTSSLLVASQLATDTDFKALYSQSLLIEGVKLDAKFPEFADGSINYSECKTLYSKLGFKDSASLAICLKIIQSHAINLSYKKYILSDNLVSTAIANINDSRESMNATNVVANSCQSKVI